MLLFLIFPSPWSPPTSGSLHVIVKIQPNNMPRQLPVQIFIHCIQHKIQQIESRDQGRRQINVSRYGQVGIVFRVDGVSSGKDGGSGVQGCYYSCFGY